MSIEKTLTDGLEESVRTKRQFWEKHSQKLLEVASLITRAIKDGNKVLTFGNGGSATDAIHFSLELVNRFIKERPSMPCIALSGDGALLTCIGNDYSFEQIFERQIAGLGNRGDIAFGISTSGNSKNVVLGLKEARRKGLVTVALLGGKGGQIVQQNLADHVLIVDGSTATPRIQETHIWIIHALCQILDEAY